MTVAEFVKSIGLQDASDLPAYFRRNLFLGKLPVALYSCPICDKILWNPTKKHKCKNDINDSRAVVGTQ